MNHKAQIKMGETLGVLIVFFLIVGISIGFYTMIQKDSIKTRAREQLEKETIRIALKAAHLQEITCTQDRDIEEVNCIDWYKATSFKQVIESDQQAFLFYEADFRSSKITLQQVYPVDPALPLTLDLYSNPPKHVANRIQTAIPVVIRDPTIANALQQKSIGLLFVEVYS
ncbi:hypothetical protein HYS47_03485 [Candidatus Woesearchaeota archaeon]|nr:hypothetical protein [Candidatus Woesearchaeota archaeon]